MVQRADLNFESEITFGLMLIAHGNASLEFDAAFGRFGVIVEDEVAGFRRAAQQIAGNLNVGGVGFNHLAGEELGLGWFGRDRDRIFVGSSLSV